MKKAIVLALAASCAAQAVSKQPELRPAEIFAEHDCCGRLEHTAIKQVGEIRESGRTYTVFSLWFVNPESRHGMKRLAVAEGKRFRGSYIISSWATPVVEAGVVTFFCDNGAECGGDNFEIADGKLPSRLWVDGEINNLENTI